MSNVQLVLNIVETYRKEADVKFAELIYKGRRGKRNLQLAAAAAAGMEHAARNISSRIRAALGEKE